MIAKLVVWGSDRTTALGKLHACLSEYNIDGLPTNVDFLMRLANHDQFAAGNVDTDFITRHYDELFPKQVTQPDPKDVCASAMAAVLSDSCAFVNPKSRDAQSPFVTEAGSRSNHALVKPVLLTFRDVKVEPQVVFVGGDRYQVQYDGNTYDVIASLHTDGNVTRLECNVDGDIVRLNVVLRDDIIRLFGETGSITFKRQLPKYLSQSAASGAASGAAVAPMPGVVEKVNVQPGDQVKAGDPLVVMIAMKMEYVIKAPKDGKVAKVPHAVGDFVAKGTLLVNFEEEA